MNRKRRRFSIEQLEVRTCMSTAPLASMLGHDLYVRGTDTAEAIWISHDDATNKIGVRVRQTTDSAGGTDRFSGEFASDRVRRIVVQLGGGDDLLTVVSQDVTRQMNLVASGGEGNDTINLRAMGDVSAKATLSAQLLGDNGNDTITIDAQGNLLGSTSLLIGSGKGNDSLGLSLVDLANRRTPSAVLNGDAGNDSLRIDFGASDGAIGVTAHPAIIADGGTGRDTLRSRGDVASRRIETQQSAAGWQTFVSAAVQPLMSQTSNLGVFVGVVGPDGSREAYSFGTTNEEGQAVTSQTAFEIGSITKTFTATLLADMVARGEVSLDDPVTKYLPADAVVPRRGGREITLLELATHTSGLPRDTKDLERKFAAVLADIEAGVTNDEHLEALFTAELTRDWPTLRNDLQEITLDDVASPAPSYSNLGMGLLGFALARRLSPTMTYEGAIRQRVLLPLGLRDIFQTITPSREPRVATGTAYDGETEVPPMLFNTLAGAGALRASGLDMLRYLDAQAGRFHSVLDVAIAATHQPRSLVMADPVPTSIGLSWFSAATPAGAILGHNGGTFGFQSELRFNSTTGAGFVVLINSTNEALEPAVQSLLDNLQEALLLVRNPTPPVAPSAAAVSWNLATRCVQIAGTADRDFVSVEQNDTLGTLVVTTRTANADNAGIPLRQTFSLDAIREIRADLGGGDDDFEFVTRGDATRAIRLIVNGGKGDDGVRLELGGSTSPFRASFNAEVNLGDGDDGLGVRTRSIDRSAGIRLMARMGAGDDIAQLELQSPAGARASLVANIFGEKGNDSLDAFTLDGLHRTSTVFVLLDGGDGDDTLSHSAKGRINGCLQSQLAGGHGNDSLFFDASSIKGNGRLVPVLKGQTGNDHLSMLLPSATRRSPRGKINGGKGRDLAYSQGRVKELRVEGIASEPTMQQELAKAVIAFQDTLPTQVLRIRGRAVEYWTAGQSSHDKPVVLLISGQGESLQTWSPIASQLAATGQVIAVNRPGFGRSDALENYTGENVVRSIHDVVEALAPGRRVIIVGHSFGGIYANLYARRFADEIAGVVFIDSGPPETNDIYRSLGLDQLLTQIPKTRIVPRGVWDDLVNEERVVAETMQASVFPSVPVTVLTSSPEDGYPDAPPEINAVLKKLQSDLAALGHPGSLRFVLNTGHYIHRDQPRSVIRAIREIWR